MYKALLTAAVVVLPLFTAAPAFAMKGIDAARSCNANPKCTLLLDDAGGATILIGDRMIDCNSPQEECVIVHRTNQPTQPSFGAGNFAGTLQAGFAIR